MPYLLQRWKGPQSIAVFVRLGELKAFVKSIQNWRGLPILFSVYIPLDKRNSTFFVRFNKSREYYPDAIFPINILRDLAIESIRTTHFFYIDSDFFVSSLFFFIV